MTRYLILACFSSSMLTTTVSRAHILTSLQEYMPTMPTWFTSTKETKTIHKKYTLDPNATIHLYNIHGSVTIETTWNQEGVVLLTADMSAFNKEELEGVSIKHSTKDTNLSIKTCCEEPKNKTVVNYKLIIPGDIGVRITNGEGDITINNVRGPIGATITTKGTIIIHDPSNTTIAQTKQGNIMINNPLKNVKVVTARGKITITNSKGSVLARTQKGAIELKAAEIPDHSTIKLATNSGSIMICLPDTTNAALYASSERGVVLCEHEITLHPHVTTLDAQAWKQFKRSITGTIGSGISQIKLHSTRSNIRIAKEAIVTT